MATKENKEGGFRFRPSITWFWVLLAVGIIGWSIFDRGDKPVETSWSAVEAMIEAEDVDKIAVVNKEEARVYLKKESIEKYRAQDSRYKELPGDKHQFVFSIGSVEILTNDVRGVKAVRVALTERGDTLRLADGGVRRDTVAVGRLVNITHEEESSWTDTLITWLPLGLMIIFFILILRGMSRGAGGGAGGGIMNVGKARAQEFNQEDVERRVTFKDVAGLEEAKVEIMEIVDFLRNADKYRELGAKIPKGALLVGPPGTGKTLLAKAVAGEANVPFLSISGSDFVEMFVGVGASRVRDLFDQAKKKAPCIVFIDEIDAIGRARGKNAGFSGNDERENTLNQLLTEMDGFQTNAGVIILAATNRADILDKALMRAGRFDRQIDVGLPELHERKEIFGVHLRRLKTDPQLDVDFLARQTPGFSGADIANVCNEAALIAARHNKSFIAKEEFLAAVDRIIGGLERRNKVISPAERRTIAYHEAGHATVSWLLEHANPLVKVTIIPRGKALGAAWYLPEERQITTREQMTHELASLLAGRVAERIFFGHTSTGALNDLERATKMAYAMVAYYGMSDKVGTLSYYDSTGGDMAFTKPYSEQTAQQIDAAVRELVEGAYELAERTITEHREGIVTLAELLLEREVVFTEDVERIFGKRKKDIERERLEAEKRAERELGKAELAALENGDSAAEQGSAEGATKPSSEGATEGASAVAAEPETPAERGDNDAK